jgi:polar amino acid transport system substrate-binding protein
MSADLRSPVRAAGSMMAAVVMIVAGCSSTGHGSNSASGSATTTTAPTATTAAPDCGNPVASFAPTGQLPKPGQMPSGSTMAKIAQRGRLIVGVSADTLLFGSRNPVTGNIEGFDVDMLKQVATAIFGDANPNHIEYQVLTYAQRIPALISGQVDIVADVMTINCSRWAQIDFSSEYFHAGQRVLVRSDSTVGGIGDLNGKRVCAATGSTNIDELKNYPKVIAVPVDDISDCMVLFQRGTVDAVTGDDTVLAGFVAQDPYAKVVGPAFTDEPYGLGIAKPNTDFVQFVNAILERIRSDGTWADMYTTWLHPTGAVPAPPAAVYGRQP